MRIFVISLKAAAVRRVSAVKEFERTGIEFEFLDAVNGCDGAANYFNSINKWLFRLNTLRDPLPGEIGCYASHLALWRTCVAMNQAIVILEDDFQLEPDFTATIREIRNLINTVGFIRLQSIEKNVSL